MGAMEVETKFLGLFKPAGLSDHIDGWRVCWVGGLRGDGRAMPGAQCTALTVNIDSYSNPGRTMLDGKAGHPAISCCKPIHRRAPEV